MEICGIEMMHDINCEWIANDLTLGALHALHSE